MIFKIGLFLSIFVTAPIFILAIIIAVFSKDDEGK